MRALACFDFDGTLAPIVDDPDEAAIPASLHTLLEQLAALIPVAIVSGRDADDVRERLKFEPAAVVGNHGADAWRPSPQDARLWGLFLRWVEQHRAALGRLGVVVELKSLSVAFHLREVKSMEMAGAAIQRCLKPASAALHVFGGKYVINAVPREAPDKSDAVARLMRVLACDRGLYVGDDMNDEPVFRRGINGLVTVRIAASQESAARFYLRTQQEMNDLLMALLSGTSLR